MSDLGWLGYLLVASGGAVGASLRHLAGHAWDRPRGLPLGTIGVNLVGSLALGLVTGLSLGSPLTAVAAVGACGALTTYSSFAVQAQDRGPRLGAVVVLLTAVPAVLLYAAGAGLGAAVT